MTTTDTAQFGDLNFDDEETRSSRPRKQTIVRYNFAAPFVFAVGIVIAALAASNHLLQVSALLAAFVTVSLLFAVIVGIVKEGKLPSTLAVLASLLGSALFYVWRHTVVHMLVPASFWVVLIALAYLVGLHVYRVRR